MRDPFLQLLRHCGEPEAQGGLESLPHSPYPRLWLPGCIGLPQVGCPLWGLWSLPLQKFVSTTIRPTLMPYPELYNWDNCAQFVSDFLSMVPLPDPLQPVSATPSSILRLLRLR